MLLRSYVKRKSENNIFSRKGKLCYWSPTRILKRAGKLFAPVCAASRFMDMWGRSGNPPHFRFVSQTGGIIFAIPGKGWGEICPFLYICMEKPPHHRPEWPCRPDFGMGRLSGNTCCFMWALFYACSSWALDIMASLRFSRLYVLWESLYFLHSFPLLVPVSHCWEAMTGGSWRNFWSDPWSRMICNLEQRCITNILSFAYA